MKSPGSISAVCFRTFRYNEIRRPPLDFVVNAADIFSNNPHRHQLHSAQKENHHHDRRISRNRISVKKRKSDEKQTVEKGANGDEKAEIRRDLQRDVAERSNPFQRKIPKPPIIELRQPDLPGIAIERYRALLEAD